MPSQLINRGYNWYNNGEYATENNTLESVSNYQNDILEGQYYTWYLNGNIRQIEHYKNDKLDGIQYYYNNQLFFHHLIKTVIASPKAI